MRFTNRILDLVDFTKALLFFYMWHWTQNTNDLYYFKSNVSLSNALTKEKKWIPSPDLTLLHPTLCKFLFQMRKKQQQQQQTTEIDIQEHPLHHKTGSYFVRMGQKKKIPESKMLNVHGQNCYNLWRRSHNSWPGSFMAAKDEESFAREEITTHYWGNSFTLMFVPP